MASNFIIFYNGREGSTAIVNSLGGQEGIHIPLIEDLDAYKYLKIHRAKHLPNSLEEIFKTGNYTSADVYETKIQALGNRASIDSVGFKWRIFGDISQIAKALVKLDVSVFVLYRRDFLNIVCSSYAHSNGNKLQSDIDVVKHPQFRMSQMNDDELEAYSDKLSAQQFELKSRLFTKSAIEQVKIRKSQLRKIRQLSKNGVKIGTLFYEDFDESPERFIKSLMSRIGIDGNRKFNPECSFTKVHKRPISERIQGLESITTGLRGAPYRLLKREYEKAIKETVRLSKI